MSALFSKPHFVQFDGNFEEKMARKQYFTMKEVPQELALDDDSDMKPEDIDFLPDGDDFVAQSSREAVLDEPVFVRFYEKGLECVCLLYYPPFQHGCFLLPWQQHVQLHTNKP